MCFALALDASDIDLRDIDLLDTDLDLWDTDIPSNHFFLSLEDVFIITVSRLPRRLQNLYPRHLEEVLAKKNSLHWRSVEDVLKT